MNHPLALLLLALRFDFSDGLQGWEGGFADYPAGEEVFYQLEWGHRPLPPEVDGSRGGFYLSGNNNSDDLFMFLKRRIESLTPGAAYRVRLRVEFATNAPSDCLGIGGPPGTGVTMKAGAVPFEPLVIPCDAQDLAGCPADGYLLLSIDKGNQSNGGADMAVLGHIGNSRTCPDDAYELKTLGEGVELRVTADPEGSFWAIVGTDSGFEGVTSLYYTGIEVSLEEEAPAPRRGDANGDGRVDLGDAVAVLFHLFGGLSLACAPAGDFDASARLEVTDAIALLSHLFRDGPAPPPLSEEEARACAPRGEFTLESAAFAEGEAIPLRHTCEGANTSPPLAWRDPPPGTRSFALTCVDPDAPSGEFVHWVAWDIPAPARALAEGEAPPAQGRNGAGRQGYTGPCPPRGSGFHRYYFTLHALDAETLPLASSARLADLQAALQGRVLGTAGVMGRYRRD